MKKLHVASKIASVVTIKRTNIVVIDFVDDVAKERKRMYIVTEINFQLMIKRTEKSIG